MLTVSDNVVLFADLESTNGVYLNETRVTRPVPLRDGDRILIGSTELSFFMMDLRAAVREASGASDDETRKRCSDLPPVSELPTDKAEVLERLGKLADRAFAEGRGDTAKRLLTDHMGAILEGARGGRHVPDDVLRAAAEYGLKLAAATSEGAWIDLVVELHMIARRPLPATVLDGFAPLLASITTWDPELFVMYQAVLAGVAPAMSAANQALCSRICALCPHR